VSVLQFDQVGDFVSLTDSSIPFAESASRLYMSQDPFAHCVIENFIPVEILQRVIRDFPKRHGQTFFDRDQERFKYQYHPKEVRSVTTQSLLQALNSDTMLKFLSSLTGIKNLLPDPHFSGGGLHETLSGGHLSIHADFNIHPQLRAQRRINLLVYLNDDWPEAYGGHLELWDKAMSRCVRQVLPVIGRAVIFNTDSDSFHGQPNPVTCPPEASRRSIALYYYTVPDGGIRSLKSRTTQFQERPGSLDKKDWEVKVQNWISDWVPSRLQSLAFKATHRFFLAVKSR
jgi:hypothetical protein